MRRVILCVTGAFFLAAGVNPPLAAAPKKEPEVSLYGPSFSIAGLKFTIPSKWPSAPVESAARAGQWTIPAPRGQEGGNGELVVFYFGPGIGGTPKENIESWISTMTTTEGHPAAAEEKHHEAGGLKISQVIIFGTYNQLVPIPGVPPQPHVKYGLLGAVIETKQGNLYWRFTGPEALVAANLPLFNKVIDSLKPETK